MDSTAPSLGGGVELAGGPKPAAAEPTTLAQSVDPTANIVLRMWRAELDIGKVEKEQTAIVKTEGGQVAYTYKFSGYDVVVAAVKPALARHGIKTLATIDHHERVGNLTILKVTVRFINVDQPDDFVNVEMVNYGADKGDKGASKALTNCVREAIKKGLGITSIEDDRADETTAFETGDGATRKDVDDAKERARANLEQWAKTFKAALESARDVKDVQRLERENKDQLISEDLPTVTRAFFVELIVKQKKALAEPAGADDER